MVFMQSDLLFLNSSINKLDDKWRSILLKQYDVLSYIDHQLINLTKNNLNILPPANLIFKALEYTKFDDIKVLILGQDPYHKLNLSNGLAFMVNDNCAKPSSLINIYKELLTEYSSDMSYKQLPNDLLKSWALNGVLLLNTSLTVIEGMANSLSKIGWHTITDYIIKFISDNLTNIVFILWGQFAINKTHLINPNKHLVLKAAHPSGLSARRGFFGCNHFILANEYLLKHNKSTIPWL